MLTIRRYLREAFLVLFLLMSIKTICSAQSPKINLVLDSVLLDNSYQYSVTIKIVGSTNFYNLFVYDNKPILHGQLINTILETNKSEVTIPLTQRYKFFYIVFQPTNSDKGISQLFKL